MSVPNHLVSLTTEEICDVIDTLTIRVEDERRMFFAAEDEDTRRRCREAGERLMTLARRLRAEVGTCR